MSTVTLQEAHARLPEIVASLKPGEKLVVTDHERAVATIIGAELPSGVPILGRGVGKMTIVADDDEHLEMFKEYMP